MYICLFSVDGSGTVHLTGHLLDEGDKIKEVSDEDDTDNFAEEEDSEDYDNDAESDDDSDETIICPYRKCQKEVQLRRYKDHVIESECLVWGGGVKL